MGQKWPIRVTPKNKGGKSMKRLIITLLAVLMLAGCEEGSTAPKSQYEDVKLDCCPAYKITVTCRNSEPREFLSTSDGLASGGAYVVFYDYFTGARIETTCDTFAIKLRKKKELPVGENLNQYLNQPAQDKPQAKQDDKKEAAPDLGRIVINNNVGTQNN